MANHLLMPLFADAVLALHVCVAVFIAGGLPFIVAGNFMGWALAGNLWFRLAHLGAIGIVVAEAWLGLDCPLTVLELQIRSITGDVTYQGGFVEHWMRRFLFYDAAPWIFIAAYTCFGLAVVATWWHFPPRRKARKIAPADRER